MTEGLWMDSPTCFMTQGRVGRERYTEFFHGTATAVCQWNERSANTPLRLDARTLGGQSRLLHDSKWEGRECSTEYLARHGHGRVSAKRMVHKPTA
ncbi:hypothetical protein TNCT_571 [Trichonephila clavata]|uniref:Uncharacterized protein n=1 Tax=Trichonephila clavata TaxID=2740835 RepID=A0A8X6JY43_TRICU|nr:hypothetical protein TNCT_571 [Trichonephila clavata]